MNWWRKKHCQKLKFDISKMFKIFSNKPDKLFLFQVSDDSASPSYHWLDLDQIKINKKLKLAQVPGFAC